MSDASTVTTPKYLIDRILPENELSLLCGPSRVGKTTLALQMLRDHHLDRPIFGCQPRGGYAVYVACDRSHASLKRKMAWLGINPSLFPTLSLKGQLSSETKSIENAIQAARHLLPAAKLVVLDGISALLRGRVSDDGDVTRFLDAGTAYAETCGVTLLGVLAAVKVKEGEGYAAPHERALGSGAWSRMSETFYSLDFAKPSDIKDSRRTLRIQVREGEHIYESLAFDSTGLHSQLDAILPNDLCTWLYTLPTGYEITTAALELIAEGYGVSRRSMFTWLKDQVANGKLRQASRGLYVVVAGSATNERDN